MGSLGDKLRKAHRKVNTKLGVQDTAIVFKKTTHAAQTDFGQPYSSPNTTMLTVNSGILVAYAKGWQESVNESILAGDLMLTIPASLELTKGVLTEMEPWITDASIQYQGQRWDIKLKQPKEIYGGKVVRWLVTARKEG